MDQTMETLDQIREFFSNDRFASNCLGARIDSFDFETLEATVSMDVEERHLNGHDIVMGGVYFTLADFALESARTSTSPRRLRSATASTP